ncbi:TonB-dependent receptor domain-containing protein [Roseateles chitinivorans]|uniref:TonB-dependent receptor domain-containing protein n=1 Tax=Roseateles chitinivorans TaxID=2917965 RepID=UPI003D66B96D
MQLLGAVEAMRNDGPWTLPEDLNRRNVVLSLSGGTGASNGAGGASGDRWRIGLMDYRADWTSTDQVPQRLIDAGTFGGRPFDRFDAVDPSDGGDTRRSSLSGEWQRDADGATTRLAAYAMAYQLALYSNFTYAMERPDAGDQFAQKDDRQVYGLNGSHAFDHTLGSLPARSEFGFQVRQDRARVGLFNTVARVVVDPENDTTRDDDVRETLAGVYGQTSVELAPWARSVVGLRADHGRFRVDHRAGEGTPAARARRWCRRSSRWCWDRGRRRSCSSTPVAASTATTRAASPARSIRRRAW